MTCMVKHLGEIFGRGPNVSEDDFFSRVSDRAPWPQTQFADTTVIWAYAFKPELSEILIGTQRLRKFHFRITIRVHCEYHNSAGHISDSRSVRRFRANWSVLARFAADIESASTTA